MMMFTTKTTTTTIVPYLLFSYFTLDHSVVHATTNKQAQQGIRGKQTVTSTTNKKDRPRLQVFGNVIDFEEFERGEWVGYVGYGTTVSAKPVSAESGGCFGKSGDMAMVFDSSNPTGRDYDLGTPNSAFGGPGKGYGGSGIGSPYINDKSKGKVLIISEDCKKMKPDDNRSGGTLVFTFDSPKIVRSMGFLDLEEPAIIKAFSPDGSETNVIVPEIGNNGYYDMDLDIVEVTKLEVTFAGSGAITDLTISNFVPLLAAVFGDPHIRGWDGNIFNFHGGCDLVMVHNPGFEDGLGLDVHIRTSITDHWSSIVAAVVKIGDDTLEVISGDSNSITWSNGIQNTQTPTSIGNYPIHYREKMVSDEHERFLRVYVINLGDNVDIVIMSFKDLVDVRFRTGPAIDLQTGMMGKFDGSIGLLGDYDTGRKMARDGITIMVNDNDNKDDEMTAFGIEWHVRDTEPMLFHNVQGPQYPELCIMPSKSSVVSRRQLRMMSLVSQDDAIKACSHADVNDREFCIDDVLTMSDLDIATMYE